MGVLADFIIATEAEAIEYSRSQDGIPSSNLLEITGVTCVELSTLLALLTGEKWRKDLLDLFPSVGGESTGLTQVADQLIDRLTDFDYDVERVAAHWAATEEMRCEIEEARMLVDELAQHAVRAKSAGKPVYLWNCI